MSGGRILVSIADEEKQEAVPVLRRYAELGHTLVATPGTRAVPESAPAVPESIGFKMRLSLRPGRAG